VVDAYTTMMVKGNPAVVVLVVEWDLFKSRCNEN